MTTYLAFLRGINVGGNNLIPMADLRAMTSSLGFGGVQTLLQSGNLVFEADDQDRLTLETQLEAATKARFGIAPIYCVRTAPELLAMIQANPFAREAQEDPGHLIALFLKSPLKEGGIESLRAAYKGPEYCEAATRDEVILVYPEGMGRSKLTPPLLERHFGAPGTARNWNTVLKLANLVGP